jgi:hypothetical protein
VLSLFTTQSRYGAGQQPQFGVDAVSTAPGSCTLPFGPSVVRVLVTRQGQVVWDSASCQLSAGATRSVWFTQGVPQVLTLTWNRNASTPGCAGSVPAGAAVSVDAVAQADGRSSAVLAFTVSS